jgi:alkylation response protein AidB-like acyl-CoA dehydrogenase
LAELGILGLNVPQASGGLGGGPIDTLIVMQAFGKALLVEPFLSTAVIAARLLAAAGGGRASAGHSGGQHSAVLEHIAQGSRRVAIAALEPDARFDLGEVRTSAKEHRDGYILDGRKAVVLHGDSAHLIIVSARTSGGYGERDGITLFLVDASLPGVDVHGFPTIDGQRGAEIELRQVVVARGAVIGRAGAGYALLEAGVDAGIAALCAEAVGVMEKLTELTAEHLRSRKQFGVAIGTFQALQHRLAEMLTAVEQARSMALLAAAKVDASDRSERRRAVSAAKVMIGRSGRFVGEQAVQLHGAMGMTAELAVGWYFKRLMCIDATWGNHEHHLECYGDLL